jgi:hypothetical protein
MKSEVVALGLVLALSLSTLAQADISPNVAISTEDVRAKKLLSVDPTVGLVVPTFKFYEHVKLTGALIGGPTDEKPLASALHTIPATIAAMSLTDEIGALKLKVTPSQSRTVVVYVMNGLCVPCDEIVGRVKSQLQSLGWGQAQFLIVNVT